MTVRTVAFCLGASFALLAPAVAQPPATATCDVVEVAATTQQPPSTAPSLQPLEKRLKRAAGGANTFKELSRQSVPLTANKPKTSTLKSGSTELMLRSRKPSHVELTVSIDDASGKRLVNSSQVGVDGGDWLMFAHDTGNNAAHLVALTCK
jgi:hypothetical protein